MQFEDIVHLQLFYKKIQNIDTFIKNEFVQRSLFNKNINLTETARMQ